jgi:hypothetical protein
MTFIDLKKDMKELYAAKKEPSLVEVPELSYLMIDGEGDPNNSQSFSDAVSALYSVSYTLKFTLKKAGICDYPVMALEGLWWTDRMEDFLLSNKKLWKWTLMIVQPDIITEEMVKRAADEAMKKKPLASLGELRLERGEAERAAHILHVGPYAVEEPTIRRLHDFIRDQGLRRGGKHREIYLNDASRTAPERLKTIIRQPVCG